MSLLKRLLGRRPGPEAQAKLGRGLMNPFPEDWPLDKRRAELPSLIGQYEAAARELLAQLRIDEDRVSDDGTLRSAWGLFLERRRMIRRKRDLPAAVAGAMSEFQRTHTYDADTKRLLECVGALLARALIKANPDLAWRIGHAEEPGYLEEGKPVLSGFSGEFAEMNPLQIVNNVAMQEMERANPDRLLQVFRQWRDGVHARGC